MTAKLPVFSKKDAQQLGLRQGPNIPVEFLDDEELLIVVEDGYILSQVRKMVKKGFAEEVRRLYEVDGGVKGWIDWVLRTRKFVEGC